MEGLQRGSPLKRQCSCPSPTYLIVRLPRGVPAGARYPDCPAACSQPSKPCFPARPALLLLPKVLRSGLLCTSVEGDLGPTFQGQRISCGGAKQEGIESASSPPGGLSFLQPASR